MKPSILITALLCLSNCSQFIPLPADQISRLSQEGKELAPIPKRKILVLPTLNKTPHGGRELAEHASTTIHDFIVNSPELLLVKASDVIDSENFVSGSGLEYNWKLIFDRARTAGTIGVLGSSLDDLWYRESGDEVGLFRSKNRTTGVRVHLDLLDVSSEQIIHQATNVGELTEEMLRLFSTEREPLSYDPDNAKNAASKALVKPLKNLETHLARLGWNGRIAKIDFHRYYINAGEVSGLTRGQLLKVFADGPSIFDPETNHLIGKAPGTFKGVLRVIDFFGRDGAVAVLHSGGNFKEKDRIEAFSGGNP